MISIKRNFLSYVFNLLGEPQHLFTMKKVKADSLALFINESVLVFMGIQQQLPGDKKVMDDYKRKFCEANFTRKYAEFEEELRHNILEYRNITIIFDFIVSCLGEKCHFEEFDTVTNQHIIKTGYEVSFLLKLKLSIEKNICRISELSACNCKGYPKLELTGFFEETLKKHETAGNILPVAGVERPAVCLKACLSQPLTPFYDERLDFETLKTQMKGITDANQRLQVVRDRLYDLKEWQILYDREETDVHGKTDYQVTEMYFQKMNLLCTIEMERIEKEIDYEKICSLYLLNRLAMTDTDHLHDKSSLNWNGSDTDLVELITALLKTNSIARTDGKKMTQKELMEAFEKFFGMEIKDARVKLQNAVQRKKTIAPYLEKLLNAFVEYTKERA